MAWYWFCFGLHVSAGEVKDVQSQFISGDVALTQYPIRAVTGEVLVATKVASWCDVVATPCLGHSAWDNFILTKFAAIDQMRWLQQIQTLFPCFFPQICFYSWITHTSLYHPDAWKLHSAVRCSTPTDVLSPGGAMFSMHSGAWWHLRACWWCCKRWAAHMNDRGWFQRMEDWKCKILRGSHHAVDCQGCLG